MRRPNVVCLLVFNMVAAIALEVPAQDPPPESTTRRQFNQVFVKVIVPVTSHTPKQDGPVVEFWVAEQLKHLGESEYFAVTDWVPVCDALLEDDIVDNRVWDGRLDGKSSYCPVGGDIPERKNGRLLVSVGGWTPGGGEANIALPDEPGSRAVGPVQILVGKERKPMKTEDPLPYVAVIITPPPLMGFTSHGDVE
ncbi:hypothetical protein SH528x_003009 [Novipirellula sp. SH528]|uniref:hypothetical protein n=1 Tax=Novipirellula sp. SH528 TaxID=3454466 RepID=UPI003FA121C8